MTWIQYLYAVVGMTVYAGGIVDSIRFLQGGGKLEAGHTQVLATAMQTILALGLIPGLYTYRHRLRRDLRDLAPYLFIIALCLFSAAWSPYPLIVARRTVTLTVCLFFGVWCFLRFGLGKTLLIYGRTTVVLCILSVIVYFAIPGVGREVAEGYENAMRGVYSQKNTLGEAVVLAIAAYLYQIISRKENRKRAIMAILFLMGCELLAQSATSFVITLSLCSILLLIEKRRDKRMLLLAGFGLASFIVVFIAGIVLAPALMEAITGRDATFTGRVPIWTYSLQAAMMRPMLGYGYGGFWVDDSNVVQWIWAMAGGWKAPNSHNGYLDIVLQIGIVGLLAYLYIWGWVIYHAVRFIRRRSDAGLTFVLLLMALNFILNLDEGPLPYPDEFSFMMPGVILYIEIFRRNERAYRLQAINRPLAGTAPLQALAE